MLPHTLRADVTFCIKEVTTLNCCVYGGLASHWLTAPGHWHFLATNGIQGSGETDGFMQKCPQRPLYVLCGAVALLLACQEHNFH